MKIAAKHRFPAALELLLREATSSGTSMSPGITSMGGNRPKVMPLVRLFSFLIPTRAAVIEVHIGDQTILVPASRWEESALPAPMPIDREIMTSPMSDAVTLPLVRLAFGRSGDKGDSANIGIIARQPEYLPWIKRALTEEAVALYFAHLCDGTVTRFDVPGIHALNFVLTRALGGGGIASLRNDPQGKGYAQMLLDYPVPVTREVAKQISAGAE
jgi:hypothetical protein